MKDVQDNKAVSSLTKLNTATNYDLTELDSLVHEVDIRIKSDIKQYTVIITIGIMCSVIALVPFTIKTKWYKKNLISYFI